MASALDRAEAKYAPRRSALDEAEERYGTPAPAPTGQSAKDVAMRQVEQGDPSPSAPVTSPSQFKARALGAVQGITSGFAPDIVEMGGHEPLIEALAGAASPGVKEGNEQRDEMQRGAADSLRAENAAASHALPGEFLQGELLGALAQPGPKMGAAAKGAGMLAKVGRAAGSAALAGGEGALYAAGTGGDVGVGAGVGAGANLIAGRLGGVAQRLAGRGEQRAASATAAAAAKAAAKDADDVAKAARAKVATAGLPVPAAPGVTNQVVRVLGKDGKSIHAIGSVEKVDGDMVTVFAGGHRIEVPTSRIQPIGPITSSGVVNAGSRDADKLVAAAEKEAAKAEAAAKKAGAAAAKADRAAKGGNKGFAKLATAAGVGGAGAYAIPSIIEDPDKAAGKLAKGAAGAAAGLALLKGKAGAAKLAEKGAYAASKALDTAAGRVTRAVSGAAARSTRNVGAGLLARIVLGRQKGQDTSGIEQQALQGGATPQEVQSAVNAGSRR